jgi:type IV pilus assembly protein PilC
MQFQYLAKNKEGEKIKGQIEAEDLKRALHMLREKELYVLQLRRAKIKTSFNLLNRKVSIKDLAMFCSQVGTMLKSGVSITKSLETVGGQTSKRALKQSIREITKDLENGNTFSKSIAKHEDLFPPVFTGLVDAGETGGVLDSVLERLAKYFENEREIKAKVKSAMIYPIFVCGFALIVLILMMLFIVPSFVELFEDLGAGDKLPLMTKMLISLSEFIQQRIISIFMITGLIVIALRLSLKKASVKIWWDYNKTKIPILGSLVKRVAVSRFCRTMALMTASGVGVVPALQLVSKSVGNDSFGEEIMDVLMGIQEGGTLVAEFRNSKFLDNLTLQMLAVGEETGNIDSMLEKIGLFHEQEVKYATTRMASLIEPVMIVIVGIMVGLIVISIMLPMFDMIKYV